MTRRWNEVVLPGNQVWYLGDFTMGDRAMWPEIVAGLNGRISIVLGNHHASAQTMLDVGFDEVHDNVIVEVEGRKLWLNHFPPETEDGAYHRGRRGYVRPKPPGPYDIALCGHIHEKWRVNDSVVNVGVNCWDFRPIALVQIEAALQNSIEETFE